MGYPICLVEIHGQDESFELSSGALPYGNSLTSDLLEVKTDKSLSPERPAGAFEIRLARREDDDRGRTWMDKIRPQNVVVIQMMNHQGTIGAHGAGEMHTVMIGLVDTITESMGITSRGLPQRQVVVRGRDMGKLFTHGIVTYWTFMGASFGGVNPLGLDASKYNAKPDQVMVQLLQDIYQRFLKLSLVVDGEAGDFWDYLGYQLRSYGAEIPAGLDTAFLQGEGSFWSFFVKCASLPFHELYIDTRRQGEASNVLETQEGSTLSVAKRILGKDRSAPTLVLRPTPFPYLTTPPVTGRIPPLPQQTDPNVLELPTVDIVDHQLVNRTAWDALVQHEVGDNDMAGEAIDDGVSRSDAEQYNVYLTFPHYPFIQERQFLLNVPVIIDEERFHKYGYKPLMPYTTLLKAPGINNTADPLIGFYSALNWRIASWHVFNDRFMSGYKTFKLLPHVHVGEKLLDRSTWKAREELYYVESVSHHFVQNEKATTTVGLTRGLAKTDYDQYTSSLLSANLKLVNSDAVRSQWNALTAPDVPS
ncbi:MAG: hypothetical protein Q7U76_13105 [Nitrospirota bacterium]|nr:hypothetical protein [Nitrospirota bacterium]